MPGEAWLDQEHVDALRRLAEERGVGPRQLVPQWPIELLEQEAGESEPSPVVDLLAALEKATAAANTLKRRRS